MSARQRIDAYKKSWATGEHAFSSDSHNVSH